MKKRLEVEFIGNVQMVGFRYTAQYIARRYPVVGYAKNLSNGNVEVAVEGEESVLKDFINDVRDSMARYIDREQVAWMEPQGQFKDFRIRG
ncbi:MAG: acylphosphatase [Candidatus Margulisbacteria bacterium]|nr:acylphosphatase [Candidatus Margulisiibacteriota bacterium]MBU1021662.1 acylphosphatase [Candidatus Margulisiibacteriota bacterium]MBU1728812.1 acylphosphatase [Candidatus Margulisiibacteriota bacterium]MBU1955778.1 acylphosphatase [Candidatus Margulisiibacteriota bacterium]